MKDLPVGISRNIGNNKGYRLNRTVGGKKYSFSSFQSLEHALRVNECVDVIVKDLKEAQEREGVLSIVEMRELLAESGLVKSEEINRLFKVLDMNFEYRMGLLEDEIARLHDIARLHERFDSVPDGKISFWERITGRREE